MNTKELIDKLERIEALALSIKNRHAANAIAVHAQELVRELRIREGHETVDRIAQGLQRNAECLPATSTPVKTKTDKEPNQVSQ